jgi:glyceraldehyde 3-phosphate dehydrogenase
MSVRIGINGFGRIGRFIFKLAWENPKVQVMHINDPFMTPEYLAYLLKYDSVHGRFKA